MAIISTRGRYALRVMIDLAEHDTGAYIPLMDIAERQQISEKYLESILAALSKNGFLLTLRGRNGGYRLSRKPEEYTIGSILYETERSLAPVACMEQGAAPCGREDECRTRPVWTALSELIDGYLQSVTLADLMRQPESGGQADASAQAQTE